MAIFVTVSLASAYSLDSRDSVEVTESQAQGVQFFTVTEYQDHSGPVESRVIGHYTDYQEALSVFHTTVERELIPYGEVDYEYSDVLGVAA